MADYGAFGFALHDAAESSWVSILKPNLPTRCSLLVYRAAFAIHIIDGAIQQRHFVAQPIRAVSLGCIDQLDISMTTLVHGSDSHQCLVGAQLSTPT